MKMHLPVCTLVMLFTYRCYNMIMQTIELNKASGWLEWRSHGLPTNVTYYHNKRGGLMVRVFASIQKVKDQTS
jgi:hypothetical protein